MYAFTIDQQTNPDTVATNPAGYYFPTHWWVVSSGVTTASGCSVGDPGIPASATSDVPTPEYACGRTLRDVGGGQWFADLEAIGPLSAISSAVATELPGDSGWTVDFDASYLDRSKKTTVALPALSTMPAGGWIATWEAEWLTAEGHVGMPVDTTRYESFSIDDDDDTGTAPRYWWLPKYTYLPEWVQDEIERLEANATAWDAATEAFHRLRLGGGVKLGDGTEDFGGGEWGGDIEVRCAVLLDPSRPTTGGSGTVGDVTTDTPPPDPTTDAEAEDDPEVADECAYDGWGSGVPILRSVLNVVNLVVSFDCLLKALFVPSWTDCAGSNPAGWCDLEAELNAGFPFSIIAEADASWDLIDTEWNDALVDRCASVDLSAVPPDTPMAVEPTYTVLQWNLPTPTGSGCPAIYGGTRGDAEATASDLYGWHDELRTALRVLLYAGFLFMVIRAFAPGADKAEEVRL